jgi:hypothetical protein
MAGNVYSQFAHGGDSLGSDDTRPRTGARHLEAFTGIVSQ